MYTYHWLTSSSAHEVGEVSELLGLVSADEPYVGIPRNATAADVAALVTQLTSNVRAGRTQVLLIRSEAGEAVGCVALTRAVTANQRHIANLGTGMIHPEHRGQGIVTGALRQIAQRCDELQVELLLLDVREGIQAEKVWRRLGFEEYGRLQDYGRTGGESYAGVYMAQHVSNLAVLFADQEESDA
ncbi:MAG TPA: GNAT family protein [Streptosporangiaceae bacterium]|nr:GNAT family protein [Streptosporangiaceae bacterium]